MQPNILPPKVHRLSVGCCCASFSHIYMEGLVLGKKACLLLWPRKAAHYDGDFCCAASCPVRKWAEGPPDTSIPGAEDHVDHVPAANVCFLYYGRLNDSKPRWLLCVAIRAREIGVVVTG